MTQKRRQPEKATTRAAALVRWASHPRVWKRRRREAGWCGGDAWRFWSVTGNCAAYKCRANLSSAKILIFREAYKSARTLIDGGDVWKWRLKPCLLRCTGRFGRWRNFRCEYAAFHFYRIKYLIFSALNSIFAQDMEILYIFFYFFISKRYNKV